MPEPVGHLQYFFQLQKLSEGVCVSVILSLKPETGNVDLLFYKEGQTGVNVVKVKMYICIANNKILLKFNLDCLSFRCLKR